MKHLKKFNESNLPSGFRANTVLNKITSNSEYYSNNDARQQALHYVDNVERATGREVVDAEGFANEDKVDILLKLDDGSEVTIWYGEINSWESGYQYGGAPGTNDKMIVSYFINGVNGGGERKRIDNKDYRFRKLSKELQDEYWQNEVYYLLKEIVPEPDKEPTHFIKLPIDDNKVFDYEIGHDGLNEIYFLSEEDARKWLESLTIKIIKK